MKKIVMFLAMILMLGNAVAAGETNWNLLPTLSDTAKRAGYSWHLTQQPVKGKLEAYVDQAGKKLVIKRNLPGNGYTAWRTIVPVEAGVYTLDFTMEGEADYNAEVYGFNAANKAKALYFSPKSKKPVRVTRHLVIPEGIVKIRIGFTASKQSSIIITNPGLFKGKFSRSEMEKINK